VVSDQPPGLNSTNTTEIQNKDDSPVISSSGGMGIVALLVGIGSVSAIVVGALAFRRFRQTQAESHDDDGFVDSEEADSLTE